MHPRPSASAETAASLTAGPSGRPLASAASAAGSVPHLCRTFDLLDWWKDAAVPFYVEWRGRLQVEMQETMAGLEVVGVARWSKSTGRAQRAAMQRHAIDCDVCLLPLVSCKPRPQSARHCTSTVQLCKAGVQGGFWGAPRRRQPGGIAAPTAPAAAVQICPYPLTGARIQYLNRPRAQDSQAGLRQLSHGRASTPHRAFCAPIGVCATARTLLDVGTVTGRRSPAERDGALPFSLPCTMEPPEPASDGQL